MNPLGFTGNCLDRCANQRTDDMWLAEQLARARHIHIAGDKTIVKDGRLITPPAKGGERIFLGLDEEGQAWSAGRTSIADNLCDLRSLALEGRLQPRLIAMLAQARSLVHWHERHGFCANCGAATKMMDAGYRRHCENCRSDHFPRTDPVVIIVVHYGDKLLLGRQASWTPGMFSALAGFMEPGETIEEAARREVQEEAGVNVAAISYVASQPWPFPSSLMIGLIGEAESDEIKPDGTELEEARWFPPGEVRLMLERKHPSGLIAPHPFAIAHLLMKAALQ